MEIDSASGLGWNSHTRLVYLPLDSVRCGPASSLCGGRDSELDPCLVWVRSAKGAESGGKGRQIRRPFHPDITFHIELGLKNSGRGQ